MKRLIDVIVASAALVVLLPLFVIAALAIKLDSPGPVFFRQERMGRGMRRFRVFKLRSMKHSPGEPVGPQITIDGDHRITRVGAFLRKSKLDEFPQLINVLRGDMSLVGPRPEVPRYVERFAEDYAVILGVRPGLTDPASFKYRNEAELLTRAEDPERDYVERILPDKIRLSKAYVADSSLAFDLVLIIKTLLEAVGMEVAPIARGLVKHRRPLVVVLHLATVVVAYYLAWNLRFDGQIPAREMQLFWDFLPWLLGIRAAAFARFRLYEGLWRYTSIDDAARILAGVVTGSVLFVLVVRGLYAEPAHPRSVFIIDAILLMALMLSLRLIRRVYHELVAGRAGIRVLVFGAGDTGEMIIRELKKSADYRVVALADDDPDKRGRRIHGVPVLGGRHDLPQIIAERKPKELLIAIDAPDPTLMRELVRLLEPFSLKLTTIPTLTGRLRHGVDLNDVRGLRVEDLLARPPVAIDPEPLNRMLSGRRIMVTGAGGSIGAELCRQIARLHPSALVMFDRYENSLHEVRLEIEDGSPRFDLAAVIGDVTDARRVDETLKKHRPEIIFHAAAHKHVPLMEEHPCEAVKNNIGGTRIIAEAAEQHGVDRFILISTDKAVNATSVMGASKRLAELLVQRKAARSGTRFSIVRFGNVLGSNGSVIPRFLEQIRKGGPITITHPEMRRFFMLIPEAVQLVLHAAAQAEGGATYVLEMGQQIKVLDMARDLIRLSGLVPGEDIKFEFVGLRPGEKLYEELVGAEEEAVPSQMANVLCVRSLMPPPNELGFSLEVLESLASQGRSDDVRTALRTLVKEQGVAAIQFDQPRQIAPAGAPY